MDRDSTSAERKLSARRTTALCRQFRPVASLPRDLSLPDIWYSIPCTRFTMTTTATSLRTDTTTVAHQPQAGNGLAIVRLTIGAMFVSVFFENLGKGLYTPAGYAGLINSLIKASHSPAAWKAVMGLAANHAAIAAPMLGLTEYSLGILLVIGLLT